MSSQNDSNDIDPSSNPSQSKKRRIPGSCDICKRKKIRCDSGKMPDNRCTNCVEYGWDCTHKEVTKTLGSAKGYVESLEERLRKMDQLLSELLPGIDVNQEVERIDNPPTPVAEPDALPRNDDESTGMLTVQLNKLKINPQSNRFFGKSSGYQLIQVALDIKKEYTQVQYPWRAPLTSFKRHEFWDIPPWVTSNPELDHENPNYAFPDEDLIPSLVDAYFTQMNYFLPLLHRQTFDKLIADRMHYKDSTFGGVLLLVCAHGARYSDDLRVLADGSDSPRSAGWRWFEQVNVFRKNLFNRTTLYELQLHALHVVFRQSCETPQGIWAQVGLGVRLSQEVGAHRKRHNRNSADGLPDAEEELWKRAFWVLMTLDRHISSFAGRPCALQDEDFDLDLPFECDDEYWEHGFQQPPDKPSSIAYFNCYLRLIDILAYAMRLIYPIKRPRNNFGRPPLTEQQIIIELDSAMNNWIDSVPAHLRWNPNRDNPLFLQQSAALYATYYYLQIFIHRPFIPSPRNPIPNAFPSLAICTNAARSCCHVLESFTKLSALPFSYLQNTAFTSAVILLLNIWSGKRSGCAPNPKREMEDVQRCREILKAAERRWAYAGRYWDILTELAFAGDVKIPDSTPANAKRQKRPREEDDLDLGVSPIDESYPEPDLNAQTISFLPLDSAAIPTGVHCLESNNHLPTEQQQPTLFSLPMYSNELGRLPVYGQFDFTDVINTTSKISGMSLPFQLQAPDGALDGIDVLSFSNYHQANTAPVGHIDNVGALNGVGSNTESTYLMDPSLQYLGHMTPADVAEENQSLLMQAGFTGISEGITGNAMPEFGAMPAMDNETMTMWTMAPTSLELDDWNNYISSVEQLTQAHVDWQS